MFLSTQEKMSLSGITPKLILYELGDHKSDKTLSQNITSFSRLEL